MRRTLLLLVLTVLLAGCGGGGGSQAPTEADAARAAALGFRDAVASHDYRRLCTRVFAPALLAKLTRVGFPCAEAMQGAFGDTRSPRLKVVGVRVDGRHARVGILSSAAAQAPVEGSLGLVKTGGRWLVEKLDARDSTR